MRKPRHGPSDEANANERQKTSDLLLSGERLVDEDGTSPARYCGCQESEDGCFCERQIL